VFEYVEVMLLKMTVVFVMVMVPHVMMMVVEKSLQMAVIFLQIIFIY
jgi:hypothetical protein